MLAKDRNNAQRSHVRPQDNTLGIATNVGNGAQIVGFNKGKFCG